MQGKHIIPLNGFDELKYKDIQYIKKLYSEESSKNYISIKECMNKYYSNSQTDYIQKFKTYINNCMVSYATKIANADSTITSDVKREDKIVELVNLYNSTSPFNSTMEYKPSPLAKSIVSDHDNQLMDQSTNFTSTDDKSQDILNNFMYKIAWNNVFSNILTMCTSTGLGVANIYFNKRENKENPLIIEAIDPSTCLFIMQGSDVIYAYRIYKANDVEIIVIYTDKEMLLFRDGIQDNEYAIHGFTKIPLVPFIFQEKGFSIFEDCLNDIYLYDIICWIQSFQAIDPVNMLLKGVSGSIMGGTNNRTMQSDLDWLAKPTSEWVLMMKHVIDRCLYNINQSTNYLPPEFKQILVETATQVNSINGDFESSVLSTAIQLENNAKPLLFLIEEGLSITGQPIAKEDISFSPQIKKPENLTDMIDIMSNLDLSVVIRAKILYPDDQNKQDEFITEQTLHEDKQASYDPVIPLKDLEDPNIEVNDGAGTE